MSEPLRERGGGPSTPPPRPKAGGGRTFLGVEHVVLGLCCAGALASIVLIAGPKPDGVDIQTGQDAKRTITVTLTVREQDIAGGKTKRMPTWSELQQIYSLGDDQLNRMRDDFAKRHGLDQPPGPKESIPENTQVFITVDQ